MAPGIVPAVLARFSVVGPEKLPFFRLFWLGAGLKTSHKFSFAQSNRNMIARN